MKKLVATFAVVVFLLGTAIGQDTNSASHNINVSIASTALVDIEGGSTFTLTPNVGNEAGAQPFSFTGVSNNTLWLNYTSVKDEDNQTRSISATLSYDDTSLPAGMSVVLTPDAAASGGSGDKGTVDESAIVLDQSQTNGHTFVTGIGSCYTGNGTNNGVNLVYSLQLNDSQFSTIEAGNYTATITYTITDN